MKTSPNRIPAWVAVSSGLAAFPATALELGDVKVNSSLGQPLRASIAYALAPNEALANSCVTLQRGASSSGLPAVNGATFSVADGVIAITGQSVVREPLMSMRLNIHCPYTPQLSRDYMLFIDPAGPATTATTLQPAAAPAPAPPSRAPATATPRRHAADPAVGATPIDAATRYRVQPGDSLSGIAERIENRPVGLWAAVGAIFDANPDAFIDNDPNRLQAGTLLTIPDFGAGQTLTTAANVFRQAEPDATPAATYEPPAAGAQSDAVAATAAPAPAAQAAETWAEEPAAQPQTAARSESPTAALQPGDGIRDRDNPYATVTDEGVVIADTAVEPPQTASSSPNGPVTMVQARAENSGGTGNWMWWLIGAGVALIAGLLLGGQFRHRFSSIPIAPAIPRRRSTDTRTHRIDAVSDVEVEESFPDEIVDATVDDDSPTHENLALDADLVAGTGLSEGSGVDVAQDFGFAQTTNVDIELPEEMSSGGSGDTRTDMIPPLSLETESILESEILPEDSDDDYDMSVIMDATKMPEPDDVTERDFEAIEIGSDEGPLIESDYTVSKEVDYQILEQDYEDELTATQALNKEISRAAAELVEELDKDEDESDDIPELSVASVTAIDATAQLAANDDDDATASNESLTVNLEADDKTVEVAADDRDETAEMRVKRRGTST